MFLRVGSSRNTFLGFPYDVGDSLQDRLFVELGLKKPMSLEM